jgi:hypothetical protein
MRCLPKQQFPEADRIGNRDIFREILSGCDLVERFPNNIALLHYCNLIKAILPSMHDGLRVDAIEVALDAILEFGFRLNPEAAQKRAGHLAE